MTEQEWNESTDPVAMLDFLSTPASLNGNPWSEWKPSDRKLRHVACAQWLELKRLYHSNESPESRAIAFRCLSHVQRAADGEIPLTDAVGLVVKERLVETWHLLNADPREAVLKMMGSRIPTAHILRDIIGNPFRPVTLRLGEVCRACKGRKKLLYDRKSREPVIYRDTSLRPYSSMSDLAEAECKYCNGTGHGPSPVLTPLVLDLAQAAYDERQPDGTLDCDRLAILSDALEDAGLEEESRLCRLCNGSGIREYMATYNQGSPCVGCNGVGMIRQPNPILAHLRSPGPHNRGCWALDLVLGKE